MRLLQSRTEGAAEEVKECETILEKLPSGMLKVTEHSIKAVNKMLNSIQGKGELMIKLMRLPQIEDKVFYDVI